MIPSRSGLLLALLAPVLAGCSRRPAAVVAPAHDPPQDPIALQLIARLGENGPRIAWDEDDRVVEPESFEQLVALGPGALPTILRVLDTTTDDWTRDLLLDVAGRIGDERARTVIVPFARSANANTRESAIEALGRIGGEGSLVVLQDLLAELAPDDASRRLAILDAMLRAGDAAVVGDVIRIGLADGTHAFRCSEILRRHPPLRTALGLAGPFRRWDCELGACELFLPAADEWYRETVLRQPSPWRPREPAFAPPCAETKRDAWTMLRDAVARGNGDYSHLRVHAMDPPLAESDATLASTLLAGIGHSRDLTAWIWEPDGEAVRCHRFELSGGERRSEFPEDDAAVTYATGTVAAADHLRLVAGLRTIAAARLVPWWSGPGFGFSCSSMNFAVRIAGPACGSTPPTPFCGYQGSEGRLRSEPLLATWLWHRRFVEAEVSFTAAQPTPAVRGRFAALFRDARTLWDADDGWWWVRERMVAMAGRLGDDSLLEPLARYLAPDYVDRPDSRARTAAAAITSLAMLTGNELRFLPDGAPRALRDAAAAYRELLRH